MVHLRILTDGATPIWSIIELQGDIMLPDDWQEQDVVELGTLLLNPQDSSVIQLTFGQHRLEGKVVTLKSPLAVLDAPSCSGGDGGCGTSQNPSGENKTERKIIGLIQQKYMFKTRPKPLITKPDL